MAAERRGLNDLEVRPVGGHAGPVGVLPPAKVLVLIDAHQCVVKLIVHGPHAGLGKGKTNNTLL